MKRKQACGIQFDNLNAKHSTLLYQNQVFRHNVTPWIILPTRIASSPAFFAKIDCSQKVVQ